MATIDLNADMGEFANNAVRALEAALMPLLTSCSIACGGHAGDAEAMRITALLAKTHGVRVGAHPSYPDREGFGRRSINIDADELQDALRTQVDTLKTVLAPEGLRLTHIKPHGALYNDAAQDANLARLIASLVTNATLVGPPGSALELAALEAGLSFAREGFVDRRYLPSGALTPRSEPDAIIADIGARASQALNIATGAPVTTIDGELILMADTLCIHSDSPGALETAKAVRARLQSAGIAVRAFA